MIEDDISKLQEAVTNLKKIAYIFPQRTVKDAYLAGGGMACRDNR